MNLSLQSVDASLNILNQCAPWQQNAFITVITSNKQTEDVLYIYVEMVLLIGQVASIC